MSNFNYQQYQEVIARAQEGDGGSSSTKIGFFKLKNDKDEALVRFNVSSLDSLQFATVHQLGAAQKWMKVSCLNPVGSYQASCPLCAAVAGGNQSIGKAAKKVYVQLMVSYKDAATGQFSAALPVIWERPAGFSREIANLLNDYGDLTQRVFKVTRNGIAGNMQTTYSISYIPLYDKPESVTTDFGAFANFNIAKHSFWEKTVGDINVFLNTGSFPEVARPQQAPMPTDADAPAAYTRPQYTAPVQPVVEQPSFVPPTNPFTAAQTDYQPPVTPAVSAEPNPYVAPAQFNVGAGMPTQPAPAAAPVAAPAPAAAPAAQPTVQPAGTEFNRAPRTFGGLSF